MNSDVVGHVVGEHELALAPGTGAPSCRPLPARRGSGRPGRRRRWPRIVIVNRSPGCESGLETVKTRVVRRAPSISTPSWTCCPARWPRQVEVGCRVMRGDRRVAGTSTSRVDVDDRGRGPRGGPHRVDQLEVAVDTVRRGEAARARGRERVRKTRGGRVGDDAHGQPMEV